MKNIQEKLQNALNYAEDIIYIAHEPLLVLDQVLIIVSANKSFYDTFKLKKSTTEGDNLLEIDEGDWNTSEIRNLLSDVIHGKNEINEFEFDHTFNKVGHKKMMLNARKIYRSDIGEDTVLLAIEDKKI